MDEKKQCGNCKYHQKNGYCEKIKVSSRAYNRDGYWWDNQIALTQAPFWERFDKEPGLYTKDEFGCVLHEEKTT